MKKNYVYISFLLLLCAAVSYSCGTDDSTEDYLVIEPPVPQSPVVLDLNAAPYANLSDYNFFEGELKNLQPVYGVLPYDLNSELFTDYAQKKRFVWMPTGKKATYTSDGAVVDFPVGAVLIKNFYYNNTVPTGQSIIMETRIMIKKESGWIFAGYEWNDEQTDAVLITAGATKTISWTEGTDVKTVDYKIPADYECVICHRLSDVPTPIGPKPQNLNKAYNYEGGTKNQLSKWVEFGYLDTAPTAIASTVDWTDTSKPLELRVRSYLDINCAHCHTDNTYCGYTPMNFAFNKSSLPENLGICREPIDFVTGNQQYIVSGQDARGSLLYFRMGTTISYEMMPPLGRTTVHQEATDMINDWITGMPITCP